MSRRVPSSLTRGTAPAPTHDPPNLPRDGSPHPFSQNRSPVNAARQASPSVPRAASRPPQTRTGAGARAAEPFFSRAFLAPAPGPVRARAGAAVSGSAPGSARDLGSSGGRPRASSLAVLPPAPHTLTSRGRSTTTDTTRRRKCPRRTTFPRVPLALELHFPEDSAAPPLNGLTNLAFQDPLPAAGRCEVQRCGVDPELSLRKCF